MVLRHNGGALLVEDRGGVRGPGRAEGSEHEERAGRQLRPERRRMTGGGVMSVM
ncbi:hypothetical protein [Streptomyces sp. NPDC052042]|uniref:hypothetical protein n=1 Tax=Streptomyces sp. NPDC052042 TaxID=3365683 RepID=UPI0037CD3431